MRLGGPFPFGQGAVPVSLAGGGQFYFPAGAYLVQTGIVSCLEWFDPTLLQWRVVAAPNTEIQISPDGYNYRLVNLSGVVAGTAITNAGSGAVNGIGAAATGVTVSFGAAPSNGIAAAAYPIVGGAINTTVAITNGGSGFVHPPTLVLDPPPQGGIQATARCTISAGAINAVTVDNAGAGYTAVPNIYVLPQYATYPGVGSPVNPAGAPVNIAPPGNIAGVPLGGQNTYPGFLPNIQFPPVATGGALLTVNPTLAGSGTLTGLVMTNFGVGYTGTTIPTITITGAGAAAATAVMSLSLTSVTLTAGGAGYAAGAPPNFETSLGLVAASHNNNVYLPRAPRGVTTVAAGAVATFVIEDPGFGLQKVPVVAVMNTSVIATTQATGTAVVGGIQDTSIVQPALFD